jgi:NYN domain
MTTGQEAAVLLVDWENLSGAVLGRGKHVSRTLVDDLWQFANRRSGERVRHAHLAAARFDPGILAALGNRPIDAERVGTSKEQADILLTVLAMDYLHSGVDMFFIATGDQDFIPLITRLHQAGKKVVVIYGDPRKMSLQLSELLESVPGLESVDIAEISSLKNREADTSYRSLFGALELHHRGFVLGGKETGKRTAQLVEWNILPSNDETEYWSLVDDICEKVPRHNAAIPGPNGTWLPRSNTRTYIRWTPERTAALVELDYAVRLLSARPKGLSIGALRSGPLSSDDGSHLDRVLDALRTTALVSMTADDGYCLVGPSRQLGYLEPLWRVYGAVTAECFRIKASSIPFGKVEPLISRSGIGQGPDQRAAGRVHEAVSFAKAIGVLDVVAVDGKRHAITPACEISRPFERAYHELYRMFSQRLGTRHQMRGVLSEMEVRDAARTTPLFGYDSRDRQRILRILSQLQLASLRDDNFAMLRHPWGEAGTRLKP